MDEIVQGFIKAFELIVSLDPQVIDITVRSLYISLTATIIASVIAIPLGGLIHFKQFGGKKVLITIIQTLFALPTVIAGLFVYLLLSRAGPLGSLGLLFTPGAMIIGQTVLIVPLMIGMTLIALSGVSMSMQDAIVSLGADQTQTIFAIIKEARYAIMGGVALGFSRAISEVGAAMILGGNIKGYTRILTTAIALETSIGDIPLSIALGIILLLIALIVMSIVYFFQSR
jgi:tungstate transport system permease protein